MEIKLRHAKDCFSSKKNQLVESIIKKASCYLELPTVVEIEFQDLGKNSYGETSIDNKRITLNFKLELNDLLIPLLHELIHLEQIHTGRLARSKDGHYVWEGQVFYVNPLDMSYEDYRQLPWEFDSDKKQQKLLISLLGQI